LSQQFFAVFFSDAQQPFSHFFPHSLPQLIDAVLSFPQPSLQQEAAVLSPFMQDFASFPLQHELMLLASSLLWRMQLACASLLSAEAILSQHAHLLFSAEFCSGADGAVWVAVCAHDATVRARMSASILCFII
jgi:hypothetical protein